MNGCTEKEYEKIFDFLSRIEIKFYNQDHVSNTNPNSIFEEKRDKKVADMKRYAFPSKLLVFIHLVIVNIYGRDKPT